jgi:serpin B
VSDVLHQAYINVDEKGTEAAAASAVVQPEGGVWRPGPPKHVILTLDKPFVFFIRDTTTGAILFMGRYVGT